MVEVPDDAIDPKVESAFRAIALTQGHVPEEVVQALRDDQASYPSMAAMFGLEASLWKSYESSRLELGGNAPHAQLIAWAWVSQTFRQAHVTFRLVAEGFSDSACANARSAFEHGIYVSLLADTEDVDFVLGRLEQRYMQTGERVLLGADEHEVPEFLLEILKDWRSSESELVPDSAWVPIMAKVCKHLENGDTIYSHYQGLSTLMHAGFGSASGFMIAAMSDNPREPTLEHTPAVYEVKHALWSSLGACGWAGWSADKIFGVEHFTSTCDCLRPLGFKPLLQLD